MTSFDKILKSLMALLGTSAYREKLARLLQYFARYLTSVYAQSLQTNPHMINQLNTKIRKADSLFAVMGGTRRILRFGPSIAMIKTLITNIIELINGKNKQSLPVFLCKTFSAVWIGLYFILDHYLWLFANKIVHNQKLKKQFEYYAILGWYLDCWTGIIKNIFIYLQLNQKQRQEQLKPLIIDTVRYLIDLPVAYGFMKPGTLPGKYVGGFGTITSLISLYQMWK